MKLNDLQWKILEEVADLHKTPEGAFSEKIFSLDRRVYHPRYTEDAE